MEAAANSQFPPKPFSSCSEQTDTRGGVYGFMKFPNLSERRTMFQTRHCSFETEGFLVLPVFKETQYKFKLFIMQQWVDKRGGLKVQSTWKEENNLHLFTCIVFYLKSRLGAEGISDYLPTESALHFKKVFLMMLQMFRAGKQEQH